MIPAAVRIPISPCTHKVYNHLLMNGLHGATHTHLVLVVGRILMDADAYAMQTLIPYF